MNNSRAPGLGTQGGTRESIRWFGLAQELITVPRPIAAPAVIALCMDDIAAWNTLWTPSAGGSPWSGTQTLLQYASDKGVPISVALNYTTWTGGDYTTGNLLRDAFMVYGAEIASHSYTHDTPTSVAGAIQELTANRAALEGKLCETGLYDTVTAGYNLKQNGILVRCFIQNANWGSYAGTDFRLLAALQGSVATALRQTHECSTMVGGLPSDATGGVNQTHTMFRTGSRHLCPRIGLVDADFADVTALENFVDTLLNPGQITILYTHTPGGAAANVTAAKLKGLIDYLSTKMEAGLVLPVTVSTACLADVRVPQPISPAASVIDWTQRANRNGDFEMAAANPWGAFAYTGAATNRDYAHSWNFQETSIGDRGTLGIGTAGVPVGVNQLRFVGGAAGSQVASQCPPLEAGRSYLLRFRAHGAAGAEVLTVTLGLLQVGGLWAGTNTRTFTLTNSPVYYHVLFGQPTHLASKTLIRFNTGISATVYLDEVSVVPV